MPLRLYPRTRYIFFFTNVDIHLKVDMSLSFLLTKLTPASVYLSPTVFGVSTSMNKNRFLLEILVQA